MSLPWYEPTRVFHVTPGSHAGWVSPSWKRPDYLFDMPPVAGRFGRGSPSGVVCYRHTQFPVEYRGAIFVLDWTFGRVLALPLQQDGSVWSADPVQFASAAGQFGFAPTDAAVGPRGDLFISIGGRGTRGGVFRIFWTDPLLPEKKNPAAKDSDTLREVLHAPQPGASWSRALWLPKARRLTRNPFERVIMDPAQTPSDRIRAIEILTELYGGLTDVMLRQLSTDASSAVRARAVWSIGRSRARHLPLALMRRYLTDSDLLVVRTALESLSTLTASQAVGPCLPQLVVCMASNDRFVRAAASRVAARFNNADWEELRLLSDGRPDVYVTANLGRCAGGTEVSMDAITNSLWIGLAIGSKTLANLLLLGR